MSYCKVAQCRYSMTHCTAGHCCGQCGEFGHGEIEHLYPNRKTLLRPYLQDVLPNNICCTVADCQTPQLHTNEAHHCPICKMRTRHTVANCPYNHAGISASDEIYDVTCPLCRAEVSVKNPKRIPGLSDLCCICQDNHVEILFPNPECYHVCVCMSCLKQMPKTH